MIDSGSITLSSKSPKKEGYLFQKLSCITELVIRTLYVSPEFANSVSGSCLHCSFLRAFALRPTVMLVFGLFPRIQYPLFGRGSRQGQCI